jgi:hypothetical protein
MRLISLACTAALAATTTDAALATSQATPAEPITTRQTLFSIPFQIDRAQAAARQPTEVQLHVSADRGANWQLYSRVKPEQGKFLFRAVTDGEYWFAICTVDAGGQVRPERAKGPGLRVVVDTTLPDLELDARQGEAGQILLNWEVTDARLDPNTLKIQYRAEPNDPWQLVAIDPKRVNVSGSTCTGDVIWWPEGRSNVVEIRAEAADTAGNSAVSHAQVRLNRVAAADRRYPSDLTPESQAGVADSDPPPARGWRASDVSTRPASQRYSSPNPNPNPDPNPNHNYQTPSNYDPPGNLDRPGPSALSRPHRPPESSLAADVNPAMGNPYQDHAAIRNPYVTPQQAPPQQAPPQQAPPQAGVVTGGHPVSATVPPEEPPQMVNSRLFELEYNVDSLGPSRIGRVVLWGTRDGGRTWASYGTDRDNQSPMLVAVPGEGLYGFRVGVQDGRGSGEKPQSGDPPEVRIGVDLTKPDARILSAEPRTGQQAGQVVIRWEADDPMLAARPVSLFYSDLPSGPWREIAAGLENTGVYAWSTGGRLPERTYLRLEVRDTAGNVGVFETPRAVALDPAAPAARIGGVRPVFEAPQTASKRYGSP